MKRSSFFLLFPFSFSLCLSCLVVFYFLVGSDEVLLKFLIWNRKRPDVTLHAIKLIHRWKGLPSSLSFLSLSLSCLVVFYFLVGSDEVLLKFLIWNKKRPDVTLHAIKLIHRWKGLPSSLSFLSLSLSLSCLVVFYFLVGSDEVLLKFFWSFD